MPPPCESDDGGQYAAVIKQLLVAEEAKHEYGIDIVPIEKLKPAVGVVLAVAHDQFKREGWELPKRLLIGGKGVVTDIKNQLPREKTPPGILLWRL